VGLIERWQRGEVTVLSDDECMKLLVDHNLGRFAYTDDEGPVVTPVNYAVADGMVLIATSAHTDLARHARSAPVAFEVDDIDLEQHSGWSVLVRGRTEVLDYDDLPAAHTARPAPWAEGVRTLYLRIVPGAISGRRLLPV
jgi:nitroimidazol reductase NimA-like FMN-containing flavoprotein (pyridoxamine 5'-phosphate oxidase superfamily)